MGLIKFFKNLFKAKPLVMPQHKNMDFIQPLSHGFDTIELNQELVVEKDWKAVIVAKGGTLDSFGEGTHKMGLAYLPLTTKALSLDKGKVVKRGAVAEVVLPQRFKCDLYFVFMGENERRNWCSDEIKLKNTKHMHYYICGNYDFLIQDPEKALKLFLIDWAKIKTGKAGKKLDMLIDEICSEVLWKKKYKDKKPLLEFDFANITLKPAVNKVMLNYGIVVLDMRIESIVFPDKMSGERFEEVFPEQEISKNIQIKNKNEITEKKDTEIEKLDLQKTEEKNFENSEKALKKPRFFKKEVKSLEFKETNDETEISKVVKGSLTEIENEGKVKKKKIPFYSFGGKEKNALYKTADEISNTCTKCGHLNPEGQDTCTGCGAKLK